MWGNLEKEINIMEYLINYRNPKPGISILISPCVKWWPRCHTHTHTRVVVKGCERLTIKTNQQTNEHRNWPIMSFTHPSALLSQYTMWDVDKPAFTASRLQYLLSGRGHDEAQWSSMPVNERRSSSSVNLGSLKLLECVEGDLNWL